MFVRLTGCPLRCQYCDTEYAFKGGEWMALPGILEKVASYDTRYVTVISGTWWGGTGNSFDSDLTIPIKAGGFVVHTAGEVHYDGAKDEEVVVQIIGVGPSGTTPVPIRSSN